MAPGVAAVVLAAGASTRMGERGSKVLLPVGRRPLLAWSLALFQSASCVDRILVVTARTDREPVMALCQGYTKVSGSIVGGATRHDSEYLGLTALAASIDKGEIDTVLVHDAARPFVTAELVERLVRVAREVGAAIPAVRGPDTVVETAESATGGPEFLWAAQTPQVFSARTLLDAHRRAHQAGFRGTDTASVLEWSGGKVAALEGSYDNLKITTPEDLVRAEQIAARRPGDPPVLGPDTFGA